MLLALNDADERAYPDVVNGVYVRRITVQLQDRTGKAIANLTPALQGGDVTVDDEQDVTRMANVTILDPRHALGFDADTYQGGALDLTRQLRIVWCMRSPLFSDEIRMGVFKGPVTALRRDGALVEIEAQGPELFGLGRAPRVVTYARNSRRTDVIRALLRDQMGLTRLGNIPNLGPTLGEDLVIKHKDQVWKVAKRLAASCGNRQLFIDGNGVPVMRRRPNKVAWTFKSGRNGGLTTPLRVAADLTRVKNHIKVTGRTPSGSGDPPTASATAPRTHQLSPWNLGPPGSPLYLTEEVTNDHLKTTKECQDYADDLLQQRLRLLHTVEFNSAPVPHLDPGDLIRVRDEYENVTTPLHRFTLPLTLDGDMTVGYADPYRLKRRRRPKGPKGGGKGNQGWQPAAWIGGGR